MKDLIKNYTTNWVADRIKEIEEEGVDFAIGNDRIHVSVVLNVSIESVSYSTDTTEPYINEVVDELISETMDFNGKFYLVPLSTGEEIMLMVEDSAPDVHRFFGNADLTKTFLIYDNSVNIKPLRPIKPLHPKVKWTDDLKNGDWVILGNNFGLVFNNAIYYYDGKIRSMLLLNMHYYKLIF